MAVPSVGCPAKGSSSFTVKIRTRTPRSRSLAASPGRTNVVSERFISLATDCISVSLSPRASGKTASWLPSRGTEVNTSTCTNGKRRFEFDTFFSRLLFLHLIKFQPRIHAKKREWKQDPGQFAGVRVH